MAATIHVLHPERGGWEFTCADCGAHVMRFGVPVSQNYCVTCAFIRSAELTPEEEDDYRRRLHVEKAK